MFSKVTKVVTLYSYNEYGAYEGYFDYLWVVGTGIAANSTLIPPPPQQKGFTVVWEGQDWVYADNNTFLSMTYSSKPLTRRQFKLVLLENDLLDVVELAINNIEDKTTKTRMQIEYTEATEFKRNSKSLLFMCQLLNLSEEQINQMWEKALTL